LLPKPKGCYAEAAEAIGYSVGGLSTKILAKVDSLGQLLLFQAKKPIESNGA